MNLTHKYSYWRYPKGQRLVGKWRSVTWVRICSGSWARIGVQAGVGWSIRTSRIEFLIWYHKECLGRWKLCVLQWSCPDTVNMNINCLIKTEKKNNENKCMIWMYGEESPVHAFSWNYMEKMKKRKERNRLWMIHWYSYLFIQIFYVKDERNTTSTRPVQKTFLTL